MKGVGKMTEFDMRKSIVIYGDDDDDVLEELRHLEGWTLVHDPKAPGYKDSLSNGASTVLLRIKARNVVLTANVFPADHAHDWTGANEVLKQLCLALDAAGLSYHLA
jgi:hypothetical protein